ncbi:Na+/H+ antiporter NhaC [Parabacteroides sp. BX2]|jgi:Na+:H+ antiporter, NhaC family|uniref:Na+/H+ antiporter NhaC n=1 Tax=Parabacteroides segnis TaxID=2763058 RepID=A0ABR7DXI5_9BACT|nr:MULTISPECIES: Na+/H+ antiporter NhaC [Parabacteroides]MBC5642230.1 Na+/H+ antiporter NhaC [Parabacteroides segnis]MCM0715895.1 Na+/H+ antiporter NhaC [Parabacteroides sp. TA-V-105]
MDHTPKRIPSPLLSLVPILVLVALLFVTIHTFGSDALSGGSQVVLLTATAVCCLIAMGYSKVRWKAIELAMVNNISGVATALIILLIIGALSGSWMISGVVPTLIYYGMQIIHPSFFLASTCIICAIVSVMTGSSWTTIATIGIALLGIGQAQGFEDGWIAGAIISGAYFGDKISPLSDTTVLASSVTDTPLFKHIKYMMITTVPSMIITLTIFTVAGFAHEATATDQIAMYSASLRETFHISLWLLIVPVITGILIAKRIPSIITLFISATLAGIFALFFQPHLLQEISGLPVQDMQSQFKGLIMTFYGSTQVQTGNPDLNDLVSTRGMSGMMNTIWLIICAMCFGGAMTASGMLGSITSVFIRFMKRTVGLVASTVASGLFLNICTADQYISIILTGNMFKDIYQKKGYESRLLSRTTEDSVTVTSVLIPWNTCGMTQATILGVATFTYLPYCFFNLISPLMSITVAAIGFKIKRINEKAESIATD